MNIMMIRKVLSISCLYSFFTLLFIVLFSSGGFCGEYSLSVQGGAVYQGYNDVKLPGNTGSRFSFKDDLDSDPVFSPRFEAGRYFSDFHYIGVMASTLRISSSGTLNRDILFDDVLFVQGTKVDGYYKFDSYRITYRYTFYDTRNIKFAAGVTGKVRDAEISLRSSAGEGKLKNRGGVMLLSYYLEWTAGQGISFLTYGDGLWSPYGRAEDVFAGLKYSLNEDLSLLGGYRILEGGADNDEVYTFALLHYAVLGIEYRF